MADTKLIARRLSSVEFSFYSPQQLRDISVCQVSDLRAFRDKKSKAGSIEDPALGAPLSQHTALCQTCDQRASDCPGHCGHIELVVPVYNPLTINWLLKLLRISCLHCYRIRVKHAVSAMYRKAFALCRSGNVLDALEFKRLGETVLRRQNERGSEVDKELQKAKFAQLQERLAQKTEKAFRTGVEKQSSSFSTSCQNKVFEQLVDEFLNRVQNKCPQCNRVARPIKKEGVSKFFLLPQPRRKQSEESRSEPQVSSATKECPPQQQRRQSLMLPTQVYQLVRKIFAREGGIIKYLFGQGTCDSEGQQSVNSFHMFFHEVITVPPVRFRPVSLMNDQKYLHDQTVLLLKVLQANRDLRNQILLAGEKLTPQESRALLANYNTISTLSLKQDNDSFKARLSNRPIMSQKQVLEKWLQLQNYVCTVMDSSRTTSLKLREMKGVRQVLQKKEGLFRMKIMGKRVNFAARSVISPDPSLKTCQVGMPLFMAKKLTFAEPVNEWNVEKLRQLVINGAQTYPGANSFQQNGRLIHLDVLNDQQRLAIARNLLANKEKKVVYRHILGGDQVFFNRQPTLHRPSLMSHRVKVLPREQTLRMHYANCKSYNADFDGDEMNLHAVQNYVVKSECSLNLTDAMHTNITSGAPIRQLIQDQVVAAALLSLKNRFLAKQEFQQLLLLATHHLVQNDSFNRRVVTIFPAIVKPKPLWTGKQLFSNIISLVAESQGEKGGLTVHSTTKTSANLLGPFREQATVILLKNQLISGVIDKNQIGSGSTYGIMHSFFEMYGGQATGKLFTSFSKLLTAFLQKRGFSCGLNDLAISAEAFEARQASIEATHKNAYKALCTHYGLQPGQISELSLYNRATIKNPLGGEGLTPQHEAVRFLMDKTIANRSFSREVDYEAISNIKTQALVKDTLGGLSCKFPINMFSCMVNTGAKGSLLNHTQCSVLLGQQVLEGARVPAMASGATLPCFPPFSPNIRHWGFIGDCFLYGLRNQDFYFHCMAGREGLVDTAIKTSRSGYLQRCLMKNLQALSIAYDLTVRDSDGSIVQFYYGQDGVDPGRGVWLNQWKFIENNLDVLKARSKQIDGLPRCPQVQSQKQTKHNLYPAARHAGSISKKCDSQLASLVSANKFSKKKASNLRRSYNYLYMRALAHPGQAVGCIAAQAIGQPATQMTLNTFHTAGHGGANLTLGIPRLREILMTSSETIKTPVMQIYFNKGTPQLQVQRQLKKLTRVTLLDLVARGSVTQKKVLRNVPCHNRCRTYSVELQCYPWLLIQQGLEVTRDLVVKCFQTRFKFSLLAFIDYSLSRNQALTEIEARAKRKPKLNKEEGDQEGVVVEPQEQTLIDIEAPVYQRGSQYLEMFKIDGSKVHVTIRVPLESKKKLLMAMIIKKQLAQAVVRQVPGLKKAVLLRNKQDQPYIQTQGANFGQLAKIQSADFSRTGSNDTRHILSVLGIQAARMSLINQVLRVLKPYGVVVDYRHLSLIADFVTFPGSPRAMNRNSIVENPSPFLKMSFQTATNFLIDAAMRRQKDDIRTPSARIALGRVPLLGTGAFDILVTP